MTPEDTREKIMAGKVAVTNTRARSCRVAIITLNLIKLGVTIATTSKLSVLFYFEYLGNVRSIDPREKGEDQGTLETIGEGLLLGSFIATMKDQGQDTVIDLQGDTTTQNSMEDATGIHPERRAIQEGLYNVMPTIKAPMREDLLGLRKGTTKEEQDITNL